MRRPVSIALICLAAAAPAGAWAQGETHAGDANVGTVEGIEVTQDAQGTVISIRSSDSPTFSVYRLDSPARLFIDFSNAELAGDITNWVVRNGLVDEILTLQYRDDLSLVTRVVVALERDEAEYDVRTEDNDVVLLVTAPGWEPPAVAQAEEAAEGAELERLEAEVARSQELLDSLQSEAADREALVGERSARVAELEAEVGRVTEREQLERERSQSLAAALADAQSELDEARSDEGSARSLVNELMSRSEALEAELAELRAAAGSRDMVEEEVDASEARREAVEAELESIEDQHEEAQEEMERATAERERIEAAAAEAEERQRDAQLGLDAATAARLAAEREAEEARAELSLTESRLASAQLEQARLEEELAASRREREEVQGDVARARQEREVLDAELTQAERDRQRLSRELESLSADQQAHEQSLQVAQAERAELEDMIERLEEERSAAAAELSQAQAQRESTEQQMADLEAERARLRDELARAEQARDVESEELSEMRAELEHVNADLEAMDRSRRLQEAELVALEERREALAGELSAAERAREREAQAIAELEAQREALQDEVSRARQAQDREETELERLRSERGQAEGDLAAIQSERQRLAAEVEAMQRDVVERERLAAEVEAMQRDVAERERLAAEVDAMQRDLSQRERLAAEMAAMEQDLAERQRLAAEVAAMEQELASLEARRAEASLQREATATDAAAPADRAEPASAVAAESEIVDVRFEQLAGIDRILVEFAGPAPTAESLPWRDGRASLVIPGARLPESLHRTLDTRAFGGPVQFVSSFVGDDGQTSLVVELSQAASEILSREGNVATWEFASVDAASARVEDEGEQASAEDFDGYNSQEEVTEAPAIRRPTGVSYTIGEGPTRPRAPRLSRRFRVTLDVVNADIQNVLRVFSDQGDVNIIASGDVSGTITLRLRDVPLDQAFALILQSQGLGWEQRGNIIRVAPIEEFEEERQRELQRIAEAFDVEPLQVRLRPISYANGQQMIGLLQDVLSSRGSASFDERTHTLILTDVADNLDAAEQLIDALDTQTPQVLIEARIVQSSETFSQGFGIQWGGDALFSAANGNATGLLFPSTIGIAGGAGQTPSDGTAATPNYAVNLPGPSSGAIGFQFGSLGQAVNLNLRLSAAETAGEAKVVSAPRILTLDGQAASISTGVSIPVQTVGAAGTNVTFIQANLSLNVTPVVTPDGFVHLELNITKNEPDFARRGANNDPTIITRTANTNLLVRDGETSVIGGIFEQNQGMEQTSIPFFADIPILGALFHDYSFQDERTETLVFITPRIVNRDVSLVNYAPGGVLMTPPEE